jgi:hypothetical protein
MIKIGLRHPSGLEIEFEGDKDDFAAFAEFLASDLGGFVHALTPVDAGSQQVSLPSGGQNGGAGAIEQDDDDDTSDAGGPLGASGEINARAVASRIEQLAASTDIERVTIIAQAALDAGLDGIDYDTIEVLYSDMGVPKPARFAKAFSNAKQRGLVKSIKYGVWAPTVQGENYARYGQKPARRAVKKLTDGRRPADAAPELTAGGELSEE